MSPFTPEQARFILTATALPTLAAEHPVTKSVIAAIPPEQAAYRPSDVGRSALDLAWHIAASEVRFLSAVAAGAFDFGGSARPESIQTPGDVIAWYSERFAAGIEALKQASGEQLTKIVDFRGIFQFPAVLYLQIGQSHTVHHRGQLSMYLRPMGAKVPSIYGESFDAREAREKAASS